MKTFTLSLVLIFFSLASAKAQEVVNDSLPRHAVGLDVPPEYPGGVNAFLTYVATNLKGIRTKSTGRILVSFVIEKDGSVSNVRIVRSLEESVDKKVIKVIKNSPRWKPGEQNGKLVRVSYSLPLKIG